MQPNVSTDLPGGMKENDSDRF